MKDLHKTMLEIQRGEYDTADKLRHDAGCPRGVSPMRLFDFFEDAKLTAEEMHRLVIVGKVIAHNEFTYEMSFEAIESPADPSAQNTPEQ